MTRDIPVYTAADLEYLTGLDLVSFTNDDAVDLGLIAVEVISEWELNLAVDIVLDGDLVFRAKLGNTGPDNDPWLRMKAATAVRFGEPSLLVRRRHEEAGTPFEERDDVDHDAFKAHGGSIPLRVAGTVIGTIAVSGEPDAVDHEVAAEALRRFVESV